MQESHDSSSASRRDFLKKAGAVAWVVPTMQIVNMASAGAAGHTGGSVVTTPPPTRPPVCVEWKTCRIKADWEGGWHWDSGVGRNDCIRDGEGQEWERCDNSMVGAIISGDERGATVHVPHDCEIVGAAHKAGQGCIPAWISEDKTMARFAADPKDISHVELVVRCCVKYSTDSV